MVDCRLPPPDPSAPGPPSATAGLLPSCGDGRSTRAPRGIALLTVGLLVLSGCTSGVDGSASSTAPTDDDTTAATGATPSGSANTTVTPSANTSEPQLGEGASGGPTSPASTQPTEVGASTDQGPWSAQMSLAPDTMTTIDLHPVQRRRDRTVVRFDVTTTGEGNSVRTYGWLDHMSANTGVNGLRLLDPVGRTHWYPLALRGDDRTQLGTELPAYVDLGVTYEMEVHFPRLPDRMEQVTLLGPSLSGPYTGLPVVDTPPPYDTPTDEPPGDPEPGQTVTLPVVAGPKAKPATSTNKLYGITEGEVITRTESSAEEKIAVDADVLFAVDEHTLDTKAKQVLDGIVEETKRRADPDKPPILVVGHTDSTGSHDYNQALSQRRANAVRAHLENGLGGAYRYKVEGRGETEPVAREGGSDDARAKARNRRVEISYKIKDEFLIPEVVTSTESTEQHKADAVGAPAARTWAAGEQPDVVGSVKGSSEGLAFTLDVHPFVRDGAYLVANFSLTHRKDDWTGAKTYFGHPDYVGADFGAFSAINPATKDVHRAVRIGSDQDASVNVWFVSNPDFPVTVPRMAAGTANHGYFYVPAPPLDVTSMTFDAGPLGKVRDVPIQ